MKPALLVALVASVAVPAVCTVAFMVSATHSLPAPKPGEPQLPVAVAPVAPAPQPAPEVEDFGPAMGAPIEAQLTDAPEVPPAIKRTRPRTWS